MSLNYLVLPFVNSQLTLKQRLVIMPMEMEREDRKLPTAVTECKIDIDGEVLNLIDLASTFC